jgi:hypothetical protein
MATTKAISAALKLVDGKKENLRKAFEDLQSHSSSLSSFTLTWPDIDAHFTSLQSSLEHKFKLLETLESQPESLKYRAKLIEFCQKMDGKGLRAYMGHHLKDMTVIRNELTTHALPSAPDSADLILGAMDGFFTPNRGFEMGGIKSCCLTLLEVLMELKPEIKDEVREKAKSVAVAWKKNLRLDGEIPTEELGFLELVAAFGLKNEFSMDDLVNCLVIVSRRRQAFNLCRTLDIPLPDVIERLISKGNQVLAIKFIFEFSVMDKFPPVPILKEYLKGVKDLVQEMRNNGKHNDAKMKEKSALKSVIKCIEDYKLESEYPKDSLLQQIENVDKPHQPMEDKKRSPLVKPHQQQSTSKRPRTNEQPGPATTGIATSSAAVAAPPKQPQVKVPHRPAPLQQQAQATMLPRHHAKPQQQPQVTLPRHQPQQQAQAMVPHHQAQTESLYMADPNLAYGWQGGAQMAAGYYGAPASSGYPTEPQMPAAGYFPALTPNGYPTEPQMPAAGYYPTESQVAASNHVEAPAYGGYHAVPPHYNQTYYPH